MKRNDRRSDCAIHCGLNVIGDRWTLVVVRDLMFSDRANFSELLQSPEKIATNTLTDRLGKLVQHGMVEQLANDSRYYLTDKALELAPVLVELMDWTYRYDDSVTIAPDLLKTYRKDPMKFVEQLKSDAKKRRRTPVKSRPS